MSVRIERPQEDRQQDTIPAIELRDGQTGVVDDWERPILVQRSGSNIVALGVPDSCRPIAACIRRVRPLPPGTRLILTEQGLALDKQELDGTIRASELKNGQIAEITKSCLSPQNVGLVVQRNGAYLDELGRSHGWDMAHMRDDLYVHPLPNGTKLVVEDNE